MTKRKEYVNPLNSRYASKEMSFVFSDQFKFSTWRKLWLALAESEKELGLEITDTQLDEMRSKLEDINFDDAAQFEKELRHDVMAHVHAFGKQCPQAAGIIHLGATSAYVGDNTDLIQMREAMKIVLHKLVNVIDRLGIFAKEHADLPTLGFTHFQPAQVTTVGKRACLWNQEFCFDIEEVDRFINTLKFRGVKGTTGTQASFMTLFEGDENKVYELDKLVTQKMGFTESFAVTGQTYSRKVDAMALHVLSNIAQSAHKFSNDLRLLQHLKEMEEPFGKKQIGSSAMAYKRNPMRSERIGSLSRFVISLVTNTAQTAAEQWFERTLDDSANKRLTIPQGFMTIDAILNILLDVVSGMVVYPKTIAKRLGEELPFMATEEILMEAVKHGGNRQDLHEAIRTLSMEAGRQVKEEGRSNPLLSMLEKDPAFKVIADKIPQLTDPKRFIGLADKQTFVFIDKMVDPIRSKYKNLLMNETPELHV